MRCETLFTRLLSLERTVVERVSFDESEEAVIAHVRPGKRWCQRCPECQVQRPGYDAGGGRRRWRALDVGLCRAFIEAAAPRVDCPVHGVLVADVPWARPRSRFTYAFEQTVSWLAARADKTSLTKLLRIGWRTVGEIIDRVTTAGRRRRDMLKGLRRIGIDEISYKKGHKYIVAVVDHDSGRLVWAKEGRTKGTMQAFFEELGPARCAAIEVVSADGADWIAGPVAEYCPNAKQCLDPFHVVQWANRALDAVRREMWAELRRSGDKTEALHLQRSRYALRKDQSKLTEKQQAKLSDIQKTNKPLYRAYLLKEQLREVIKLKGEAGKELLDEWCAWAQRCRLKPFVELNRRIKRHRETLDAALDEGISNALSEGVNTRLRLISRMAFGFHSATAFIAMGMLKLGGLCPPLPGRA